jgi:hypothetical protein
MIAVSIEEAKNRWGSFKIKTLVLVSVLGHFVLEMPAVPRALLSSGYC